MSEKKVSEIQNDIEGKRPFLHVPLDEVHGVLQVAIGQEQGVPRQAAVKVDLGNLSGKLLNILCVKT